ncbi:DUF167 domain-containing protein [Desulfobotulus sp.]|jgi:uncharacterized protein (TIGR00251 family)|uniref:DUF167 domain-containing protein n=1 Tax=Desulfobotulus sp. TaxID=1940337 RepID=UPI002A36F513|nr:DUF167 domain-containing protein [Desulfobotulus sp.]MDY0161990.1 DUF167 domain-containing protein [Desulfobotulus sp.]
MADFLSLCKEGVRIALFVQPKASKNEILGLHGNALKIRIKAPPVDGAANEACIQFIAKMIRRPPSSLCLVSGHSSRQKQLLVPLAGGESPDALCQKIREHLEKT